MPTPRFGPAAPAATSPSSPRPGPTRPQPGPREQPSARRAGAGTSSLASAGDGDPGRLLRAPAGPAGDLVVIRRRSGRGQGCELAGAGPAVGPAAGFAGVAPGRDI